VGQGVTHTVLGHGVVKETLNKGFILIVEFENGQTRRVRIDEVGVDRKSLGTSSPGPSLSPDGRFEARRMIEAFRLGIVPQAAVRQFTFGRDAEIQQITKWLDDPELGTLVVSGNYGSGKSHLIEHVYGRALQDGYAVARVELDLNETPFHKPKRVYTALARDLRFIVGPKNGTGNIRHLLEQALSAGALADHSYFANLKGTTRLQLDRWEWIEARETARPWDTFNLSYVPLPALYDFSTTANIYTYLLTGLSWAVKEVLGLKGLLLLFDEAESIDRSHSSYQSTLARNFVSALLRAAANEQSLLGKPGRTDLNYCSMGDAGNVPFLYRRPCHLKLLFAFTALEYASQVPGLARYQWIELRELSDEALAEIFLTISQVYRQAYTADREWDAEYTFDDVLEQLGEGPSRTRRFVKATVEALDLSRFDSQI